VLGKEYPPYTVTVERGRIKDFARAIGDLNSFYLDDAVGRASEWGDVIAPPTFMTTFRDEGGSGAFLKELGVDISRILHGEQEFEIYRQLRRDGVHHARDRGHRRHERAGRHDAVGDGGAPVRRGGPRL
jgi:hypothetical protein